jgi:hypothetical protein
MLSTAAECLNNIDEAITSHRTSGGAKSDVWFVVQNNITCVNSVIKKTSDIAQAESGLREAALHYTGGPSITATIFRDKAEEDSAFELTEIALAHYRESLETANHSEKAKNHEAIETAKLSEMAKILRSGQ